MAIMQRRSQYHISSPSGRFFEDHDLLSIDSASAAINATFLGDLQGDFDKTSHARVTIEGSLQRTIP